MVCKILYISKMSLYFKLDIIARTFSVNEFHEFTPSNFLSAFYHKNSPLIPKVVNLRSLIMDYMEDQ
jgi:hypothetical protein